MDLKTLTITEFSERLSSKAPVPGGGGVSALVGALGAALGGMVAELTVGKKKYADVEDEIVSLRDKTTALRGELLDLIQADADCFEPLSRAYASRSETELEEALKIACDVPLKIMEKCGAALETLDRFARIGSRLAISDAGAGALLCEAALKSAELNVFINASLMKDREKANEINSAAKNLSEKYADLADGVYERVLAELRGDIAKKRR
jgi:formiminotetrahydrofolate cyclodeaminase